MPTHPLNPQGGRAERLSVSVPDNLVERADRLAKAHGFKSRSDYLRARLEQIIDAEEAELPSKGELTKAS